MHIHSIWRLWNTFYVFDNEVGAILDGFIVQARDIGYGIGGKHISAKMVRLAKSLLLE